MLRNIDYTGKSIVRNMILILITIVLMIGGCSQYVNYTPDPNKDVDQWITNFANQRSFNYHYIMKTMSVYTEAYGECLIGIGEHLSGMWQGNEQKLDFEYYGLYDLEYEKQNGHWIENVRGEQTEILTQIERVLEFDEFEYQPDVEMYTYRFKANVAFLSPIHRKEMVGSIRFSGKDYRPVEIWAGLPDSSVYWMVKLSDYNRLRSIKPPVMKWQEHTIDTGENYGSLKKRFNLLDIPYRIKRGNQKVEINVPGYISADELQRYFDKVE